MNEKTLHEQLVKIQQTLKVSKNNTNEFGHYKYRSCEDILEAVKPILGELSLVLSDEIVNLGSRYYVKATANLSDGKTNMRVEAFARESEDKKGMDDAQITGATSSYARKYALNGLFAIDDTRDADTMDNTKPKTKTVQVTEEAIPWKCPTCKATKTPSGKVFHSPTCTNKEGRV